MQSDTWALRRDEDDVVHRLNIYAAMTNTRETMTCGKVIKPTYASMNTHGRVTCLRCASAP